MTACICGKRFMKIDGVLSYGQWVCSEDCMLAAPPERIPSPPRSPPRLTDEKQEAIEMSSSSDYSLDEPICHIDPTTGNTIE